MKADRLGPQTGLVFVYNADRGLFNTLADIAHKIFAPATYSCSLCAITYGAFGMRREWKEFLEALDHPIEFLHRDELVERYGLRDVALPAIFRKHGGDRLEPWINAATLNKLRTLDELKKLISDQL